MEGKKYPLSGEALAREISRRRFLKGLGLGAAALSSSQFLAACAFGGSNSGGGSGADDVTGSFDWKREDGTAIKLLLNKHPYTDAILENLDAYALYPQKTVFENMSFPLRSKRYRVSGEEARKRVERAAATLNIPHLLGRLPRELSGGQKQRVALGRVLVRPADVLLLDEPLSHLDLSGRTQTRREIKHLQTETGYTTVLVTHDQLEALSMADRIALMNEGVIQQVGTPEEVYEDPANLFVAGFIGDTPMNLLEGRADKRNGATNVGLSDESVVSLNGSATSPGQAVVLGVRPEDVRIVDTDGPGVVGGTVFAHEPLQEAGFLSVSLPGVTHRVGVRTPPEARFKRDEAVRLRFDPARTHLFDAKGGDRIR